MNDKWGDKTTLEKVATIISGVALLVWLVLEMLGRKNNAPYTELGGCIALCVICVCEAISFWRVKRSLSYVGIAGVVIMLTALILLALL